MLRLLYPCRNSLILRLIIVSVILISSYPAVIVFASDDTELVFFRYQEKDDEWVITDLARLDERVRIQGYGFERERRYIIYLSDQKASIGDKVDDRLTKEIEGIDTYERVAICNGDRNGEFRAYFNVPTELYDGERYWEMEYGTYYVYVINSQTEQIDAKVSLTVIEEEIVIDMEQGHIGEHVLINGAGFSRDENIVVIYFSNNVAKIGDYVADKVTAYEIVGFASTGNTTVFNKEISFEIPDTLSEGNDAVISGDYYFYAAYYLGKRRVEAITKFTVLVPEITLDPPSGVIGTEVQINGTGFSNNQAITVKYDGEIINVVKGESITDSSGQFKCTIINPSSSAGAHLITVTDTFGYEHEAQFTVEPGLNIEPASGVTGTQVKINGMDFGTNQRITVKYDNEHVDIASGDTHTDDTGKIACNIIIPDSTTGSHTINVIDENSNISKAVYVVQANIALASSLKAVEDEEEIYLVQVSGTGFGRGEVITLSLDGEEVTTVPSNLYADDKGSFDGSFEVSSLYFIGTGLVKAEGNRSGSAEAQLNIMDIIESKKAEFASISLSPATSLGSPGHVGMLLTINGVGFTANTKITLGYTENDEMMALNSETTDILGNFSMTFAVPDSAAGSHKITATDGINSTESVFTMEAESPPTPNLLLPQLNKTVESEYYFLWEDVQDVSGVSYILQVSPSADFTTLLVDKKELMDSIYNPTEQEYLKLIKKETPYYWRVKAVDGAYNESEWAPAAAFYVDFSPTSASDQTKYIFYGAVTLVLVSGIIYLASRMKWHKKVKGFFLR